MKIFRNPQEWEPVRTAGKPWFLIRYGVLGRGLPLVLLCAVVDPVRARHAARGVAEVAGLLIRLGLFVVLFSFTGVMTANATWKLNERRFGGTGPR